jgi:hypothetical protein
MDIGILQVKRVNGIPTVFPADVQVEGTVGSAPYLDSHSTSGENLLKVVWDKGPVKRHVWDDFATCRARARGEWSKLPAQHDPVSQVLREKTARWIANHVVIQ